MSNISRDRLRQIIRENSRKELKNNNSPSRTRTLTETRLLNERHQLLENLSKFQIIERKIENASIKIKANMILSEGFLDTIKKLFKGAEPSLVAAAEEILPVELEAGGETSKELERTAGSVQEELIDLKKETEKARNSLSRINTDLTRYLLSSSEISANSFPDIDQFINDLLSLMTSKFQVQTYMKSFDQKLDNESSAWKKISGDNYWGNMPAVEEAEKVMGAGFDLLNNLKNRLKVEIESIKSRIEKNASSIESVLSAFTKEVEDSLQKFGKKYTSGAGDFTTGEETASSAMNRKRRY